MPCPSLDELEELASGNMDAEALELFERHVDSCPICKDAARELRANLRTAERLRSALRDDHDLWQGDDVPVSIGRYRILEEIGRGGMGVVYVAEQDHPRRHVALKVIRNGQDSSALWRRFENEANLLGHLRHPGIAQIYEAGAAEAVMSRGGRSRLPFLAMELVEGERVDRFAERMHLPHRERLNLLAHICDAVQHAHLRGVIHRDLKPSNILVVEDLEPSGSTPVPSNGSSNGRRPPWQRDDSGSSLGHDRRPWHPKILDFGVARATQSDIQATTVQTSVGQLVGTLPYMSPEQVLGDPTLMDGRSDVYALGVLAYRLLAGRPPYELEHRSLPEAARIIREQEPVRLGSLNPRFRGDIEAIVHRALDKDPERRYQSAAEMAADLRRFLNDEPVSARPPSALYQLGKLARRHKPMVIVAVIASIGLLAMSITALRQAFIADRARDLAERRLAHARQPLKYLLIGVGSQIGGVLGNEKTRRHLAEESYVFNKRLAEDSPDDLESRRGYCRSIRTLAEHSFQIGDRERTRLLIDVLEVQLNDASLIWPDADELKLERGGSRLLAAEFAMDLQDRRQARKHYESALEVFEQVAGEFAFSPAICRDRDGIGVVQRSSGETPLALAGQQGVITAQIGLAELGDQDCETGKTVAYLENSYVLLNQLMECDPMWDPVYRDDVSEYAPLAPPVLLRNPSRPHYLKLEVRLELALGRLKERCEDLDGARERYIRALEIIDELTVEQPNHPTNVAYLAECCARVADVAWRMGDIEKAHDLAHRALGHRERLADADPMNVVYQRDLAAVLELLASISRTGEDAEAAARYVTQALELRAVRAVDDEASPVDLHAYGRLLLTAWPEDCRDPELGLDYARRAITASIDAPRDYFATEALGLQLCGFDRKLDTPGT